jgi:hypothetical protein
MRRSSSRIAGPRHCAPGRRHGWRGWPWQSCGRSGRVRTRLPIRAAQVRNASRRHCSGVYPRFSACPGEDGSLELGVERFALLPSMRQDGYEKRTMQPCRRKLLSQRGGTRFDCLGVGLAIGLCHRQLRLLSTNLFLPIQGIMARSRSPTSSIGCSAVRRRIALKLGCPARFSRTQSRANRPD